MAIFPLNMVSYVSLPEGIPMEHNRLVFPGKKPLHPERPGVHRRVSAWRQLARKRNKPATPCHLKPWHFFGGKWELMGSMTTGETMGNDQFC